MATPLSTRPALARVAGLAIVGAAAVVPVWASPALVTADGPSHAYNAMVGVAIGAGAAPFAAYLTEEPGGLRPNQATEFLLAGLGARLGWERAERCVLTLAMLAWLGVAALALDGFGPAALVLAGWLAHSWFAWMGFYDFALSAACYAGLVAVLARPRSRARSLTALALLLALYAIHFFTFTVGAGLVAVVLGGRALRREAPWLDLALLVPAAVLFAIGAGAGGVPGAPSWSGPWPAVAALAVGDIVRSFHPLDAIGGVAIVVASVGAVVLYARDASRAGGHSLNGIVLAGGLLLVASLVAPAAIGAGGYIPLRLQLLGVVTLFPATAAALRGLDARWVRAAAVALLVAFTAHGAYIVRVSRPVAEDEAVLERLLAAAGAGEGAWVRARFVDASRGLFRITGYRHLVERIATRERLVVLDNYEALYGIFGVSWRARPDWLGIRRYQDSVFAVELVPGTARWDTDLYLVHESHARVVSGDARLELGPTVAQGAFAVTPVKRRG